MAKKKVYRLKKKAKIAFILILLLGVGGYFGITNYLEYRYHQTNEYKLLTLGYSLDDVKLFEKKLTNDQVNNLLTYQYNEFIPSFVNEKYFLYKNLDKYLSMVVTKDQDFFKYKGVDGYEYDSIVASVNTRSIETPYENYSDTKMDDNYSILVNKYNKLPENYEPDDLVSIPIKYYYGDAKKIRSEVYDAFVEMWNAANEEGIYLIVASAFRNEKDQASAYKYYENIKGVKYADSLAARPGFSEHQTGLALDIYSKECTLSNCFESSNSYKWLVENSYKYGFVLRYPKDKEKLTGYSYESWHYRYLGKELAKKVYDSGITYDEYYEYYLNN